MENQEINPQSTNLETGKSLKGRKHIYKFILLPFSFESSNHFNKIHKRKFNSFGCIHELRKLSGSML
ncbi:hypothetical protein D7004_07160 [Pedobacter jejuensis]|uniref:Uncharacterized protein n=1 Tax=Pedobacter jejuensis TaxID=1268550 RepID=A0A3N0BXT5_9SPHI|nr:hypothetical protein D7004_07160 [Pedobacter jejuensis]